MVTPPLFSHSLLTFLRDLIGRIQCPYGDSGEAPINIADLIEKQRGLACSKNPFERVFGSLLVAGLLKKRLALLPNQAVGQLMFDVVWNVMDAFSPELAICQIATERLLNSSSAIKTAKENPNR